MKITDKDSKLWLVLLCYGINYDSKWFYSRATRGVWKWKIAVFKFSLITEGATEKVFVFRVTLANFINIFFKLQIIQNPKNNIFVQ